MFFFKGCGAHGYLPFSPPRRSPNRGGPPQVTAGEREQHGGEPAREGAPKPPAQHERRQEPQQGARPSDEEPQCGDRKSTRLNSSHANISYAVFCLKKKKS